jgi:transcriptional regulator with XRE-family HTH domain
MSIGITTTITIVGPGTFRQWRTELGKSEAEMAAVAGISTAQYQRAETTSDIPAKDHVAIVTAYRNLGKEATPIEKHTR